METPIKSDDLLAQWSRGQWKPHYLFVGQEDFLIDQAFEQCVRHWLGDNPEALSLERLDAGTHSIEEIAQAAQTVPLFGGKRILRIQHASHFTAGQAERMAEVLRSMDAESHCIFLWGKEWNKREDSHKPLVEAVGKIGQVVIFWPPFPEQVQRWTVERARHYKKSLSPGAAGWLVQQSGESLMFLDQELAKCAIYVGDRPEIDLDDVQASYGYQKAGSPFDWITLIRRRKGSAALGVLDQLLKEGEVPVRLLALVSQNLRGWLGAVGMSATDGGLTMRFHLKRGEENQFVQDIIRWGEDAFVEALAQCVEADQAIKTGKESPEMALTLLTLRLCRREFADAFR